MGSKHGKTPKTFFFCQYCLGPRWNKLAIAKIALFAFITPGEFTLDSDRRKRDFAYNIFAPAIAATTQSINQAEQRLRQRAWFDRGNSRQTSFLPGYCIGRNLVTNGEYQEFIQAKNY